MLAFLLFYFICKYALFLFNTYSSTKDVKEHLDVKYKQDNSTGKIKGLSTDEKVREQNRIRQLAFKVRERMPKDYKSFVLIAAHLVKNAHRYYAPQEIENMKSEEGEPKSVDKCNECIVVNRQLREIRTLKRQNRIREQQKMVSALKEEKGSYRTIASIAGIPLKTVHEWCAEPKERMHKGTSRANLKKAEFINFLMQDMITYSHPSTRYADKKFLMNTWAEVYQRYLQQPEYHSHGVISRTSMRMYKPKYILLSRATPVNQCLCNECENFELIRRSLLATGIKGILANKYKCLESTYCDIQEGQFGTSYDFAMHKCITRNCDRYGYDNLKTMLEDINATLLQDNK